MATQQTSLAKRLRATMLLVTIIVLLVTATAFAVYEVIGFRAQLARHLVTVAAVVADNSRYAISFDDPLTGTNILGTLRAEATINAAAIFDDSGKLMATYPPGTKVDPLPHPLEFGPHFGKGSLVVYTPIYADTKSTLGTLYIRSSLEDLYGRVWTYIMIVAFVLTGSIALAVVLSQLFQSRISRPILALADHARTIATRGDYSLRATKLTADEVGVLTDSFNHLVEQVQQREQALRKSEQALRDQLNLVNIITENTPSCLWMLDEEGRCTFANPASERISGYRPDELLGKYLHNVVHHKHPDGSPFPIEECELDGKRLRHEPIEGHEDTFVHKDGRFYPVRCNARPITREGRPVGMVIEVQDITDIMKARRAVAQEQQRLERMVRERTAALQDTVQQLETFSYSIVHDMRAPLRTMNSFASILMEEEGDKLSDTARDYMRRIVNGAQRLDALINDVLSYSRVSKGDVKLEAVPLEDLVRTIVREYPHLNAHAGNIQIQSPLPVVIGSPALLTQCISNLLSNAVKFVPADRTPHVVVRAEERGENIRIWIDDNGIGIASDAGKHLFGLFQRAAGNEYPGTGVGLAIVKRAVERMNGSAGFESTEGEGSHFWIELRRA